MNKKLILFSLISCMFSMIDGKSQTSSKDRSKSNVSKKTSIVSSGIKVIFASTQDKNLESKSAREDYEYCVELLKNYMTVQRQRDLTLDEMVVVINILMFVYLNSAEVSTRGLEIWIGDNKMSFPFSEELFARLCGKTEGVMEMTGADNVQNATSVQHESEDVVVHND